LSNIYAVVRDMCLDCVISGFGVHGQALAFSAPMRFCYLGEFMMMCTWTQFLANKKRMLTITGFQTRHPQEGNNSETEKDASSELEVVTPHMRGPCVESDASVSKVEAQCDSLRRVILEDSSKIESEIYTPPIAELNRVCGNQ